MATVLELMDRVYPKDAFAAHAAGRPIMLYFYDEECGACKSFHGRMVAVTSPLVLAGDLTVLEMNYEAEIPKILADNLNVLGFPAMAFVVDGEVIDTYLGAGTKRDFQEWLDTMMKRIAKEAG